MRWYVPFGQLSPRQQQVIQQASSTLGRGHWLQGFAGTGKTIVLAHLMEGIARTHPRASISFITFTHALKDMVASGLKEDVAQRIHIQTHTQFLSERKNYDFVFLDEVQDISAAHLTKIRSLAGQLLLAGDPDQRIYDDTASGREIMTIATPRVWRLLEVFRLTERLRTIAMSVLPSATVVEGEMAGNDADVTIRIVRAVKADVGDTLTEIAWVWKQALGNAGLGAPSAILLPTHKQIAHFASALSVHLGIGLAPAARFVDGRRDYSEFNAFWQKRGVPLMFLGSSFGSISASDHRPLVYVMTFHSSKGLDFENVLIPHMNEDAVICNERALAEDPERARRLLFVAVTRSRRNLFITHITPRPHPYLADLPLVAAVHSTVTADDTAQPQEEEFF
jgi:hypothetical protein